VREETKSANKLHKESIIIDGLNISVWDKEIFSKFRIGGITAVNATTACWENFRDSIRNIEKWNKKFETFSDYIMPIRNVEDIKKAKKIRKTGIIIGFQNITPIEDDINLLRIFKDLGVRIIQLTFQDRNYVGDGCWEITDAGLSKFGLRVIQEMNRQGILIDLSHAGDKTTIEAIEASEKPVTFTHTNPRSLKNNLRNKTDEQILALADKGGVIGATLYPPLLSAGYKSELNDFLNVIDYLVSLVGIDHVAVGSDLTENQPKEFFIDALTGKSWEKSLSKLKYPVVYPKRIRSVSDFPNITEALVKRGYTKKEVKKIMGENWFQLYSKVWKV
jgi:membrane dipeptidase